MDPITIIGLAASVVQLVDAAKKVLHVIRSFKDGDKELTALAHDLSAFTEALISFDRILRSKHTLHRVSGPVLEDMLGHSKELVQELETHITRVGSSSLSTIRRAKWVQYKSSINKLHTKLKEKNVMLHTFLSIAHAETFIAITSQFPSFMLSQPTETTETTILQIGGDGPVSNPSNLQPYTTEMRPRKNSNSSNTTSCNTSDTTSLMERLSIISSINSIESSTSWGSSSSASDLILDPTESGTQALARTSITHGSKRQLFLQDMFVTRKSCQYNCHCQCHEEPAAKPPRRFIGSQGGSKNRKSRCTDPACMGNEALEDTAEQHSRSFRKVLSSVMSAKSVEVRYDLRTFRMVPEGSDPMRYVKHGNLDKLKACIESGEATIWDTAPDGWSFLHAATYNKQVEIVKYLLELGVATNSGDIGTRIPADFAVLKSIGKDATKNEKRLVELFGEKDDVLADFEFTPIHTAVLDLYSYDDRERPSLEELIQLTDEANNAPVTTNWAQWKLKYRGRSPLFSAILEYFRASAFEQPKGTKIIHNLIDQKDKKYHWTPLHWAASSGRVKEMYILIDYSADPVLLSNLGANIIHAAVESKFDSGLVAALKIWKRCSDQMNINQVNIWGETAVHVASCLSASCVKLLLDAGADPSTQDENGQVALHFAGLSAQSTERSKVASVLCNTKNTTHINIKDYNGRPPVFDFLDDAYCVEILLRHGAKVDITDHSGQNAFHHACIHGEDASLQVMLKLSNCLGAAVMTDNNGNTPLIEALSNSHVECAMTLLQLEDVGPQIGKDGWAPIHYAAKIGEPDLLKIVCQHCSFKKAAKTLDGKRASIVAMEAGTWNGTIKDLIREYDYIDWGD
ncbi:ankyrin repeat protein [Xylaria castorea]|nr:ankyrin repeat protein [Xylaria castorea]